MLWPEADDCVGYGQLLCSLPNFCVCPTCPLSTGEQFEVHEPQPSHSLGASALNKLLI